MHNNLYKEGNVDDFYHIEDEEEGMGSTGIIKKAYCLTTGDLFCVKIIDKEENDMNNINNELCILEILYHPNIVQVYEFYDCYDCIFIVMEYMAGGELFDRIIKMQNYTEKEAREAFKCIVDSVRYCHEIKIVHRDLKPENILYKSFEEDSLIKISDFGIAKYLISNQGIKMYTGCGTPNYIAPEIIKGNKAYTDKVDIWSLGVLFYVMLCGYPPFVSEKDEEDLNDIIVKGDFQFPESEWKGVSEAAKDLIRKMIVLDPSKRLSAKQVLNHEWMNMNGNESINISNNSSNNDNSSNSNILNLNSKKYNDFNQRRLTSNVQRVNTWKKNTIQKGNTTKK